MRKVLTIREHEEIEVPLSDMLSGEAVDLYEDVQGKDYLQARLSGNRLVFAARSHVGLIPLNDRIAIEVLPKVPVDNLTHIVRLAKHLPAVLESHTRKYRPYRHDLNSILDLVAAAFLSSVDSVVRRGLQRNYVARSGNTSFPRGRILLGQTLRFWARGQKHVVAASWYEPSINTPANRLLKYAIWRLAERFHAMPFRKGYKSMLTEMQRLFLAFENVTLDRDVDMHKSQIDLESFEGHWAYYAPAAGLALLILENEGVEFGTTAGHLQLPTMLINMDDLFEQYAREVLRTRLSPAGFEILNGNLNPPVGGRKSLFDGDDTVDITPDIVIKKPDGEVRTIVEVKYKVVANTLRREDLSQAITYALSYGATAAVLVHASAGASTTRFLGKVGNVLVFQYGMNLRDELDQEEDALAYGVQQISAYSLPRSTARRDRPAELVFPDESFSLS